MAEDLEPLKIIDGTLSAVDAVVDDECLSLALEALFGDDLHELSEFREELAEGLDQSGDSDALIEVVDLIESVCQETSHSRSGSYIDTAGVNQLLVLTLR